MKPPSILTALRTGAYLHHLQLLSEAPARLADFYGSAMDMTVKPLGDDLWLCQGPTRRILVGKGHSKTLGFAPSLAAIRLGSMSSGLELIALFGVFCIKMYEILISSSFKAARPVSRIRKVVLE
jgi:hypothetical protein